MLGAPADRSAYTIWLGAPRIGKGRRSGILWWNVRDGWPQISDAVVDYYGARKLAYHVVKRIQQDVCVMLDEPEGGNQEVVAVNDTLRPVALEITIHGGAGSLLSESVVVPANGKIHIGTVPTSEAPALYQIEWRGAGVIAHNHYLAGSRPFDVTACREWYGVIRLCGLPELHR